ncbi:glycine zipper 2TM domain-containing protein [Sphingomonas oligophenolica]|uniref:17 kDa surface antigen n=1 Tax=Sphingomonas oligophenolica TaxID=301154 RepID=A0A502CGS9_9SPHN|nr:glycine zipper 2TM domain-containing protein [Sphingomonas oligophenolica]TPG10941.1 glycine zipper 2TM domain-containing protein [Sphingomonas oligophenolica]
MRKLMLALGCTAMVVPSMVLPVSSADAQRRYKYREFKDRNGHWRCKKPDGTTGTIIGGVAGALVGRTIDTRGDRTIGTLGGAVAGALAGRAIEKSGSKSCR